VCEGDSGGGWDSGNTTITANYVVPSLCQIDYTIWQSIITGRIYHPLSCVITSSLTNIINISKIDIGWDSGNTTITANYVVPSLCQIDSTSNVDFGNINDIGKECTDHHHLSSA
jgi:hypothetical protein